MPLPQDNRQFELGNFTGFKTYGLCRVAESFKTLRAAHIVRPVRGSCFAVLDDPEAIDDRGARKPAASGIPPADTSKLTIPRDRNNNFTIGEDGAILECTDVTLEAGQSLWFHWAFARFDWSPSNDFAMFNAYAEGHIDDGPTYAVVLQESLELESMNRWYSDWRVHAWRPARKFHGTLRWIVSNGLSTSLPEHTSGSSARPSALLIDGIDIG
jgi:hypothetical protein